MLKNRIFLIGLGLGIMIGALLFQLMLSGEQSREKLAERDNETTDKLYTQIEVDALLKAERDSIELDQDVGSEASKQETQPAVTPVPSAEPPNKVEETAESPTVVPENEKAVINHVIRIKAGIGLSKTAELLTSNHIIDDGAAFIAEMKKSKKLVRAGYFLFHEDSTIEQVITVVTSQPLTEEQAAALSSAKNS
ncbi:hypothetical protein FHS16_002126 [Paenibacillus endophyticus]|uniref:Endolytic transglycosylase MltG n=1 Tax=Paenibacillus endophyticus TaxID=1294268 RepID=A0A7W5G9U5_9BACL|nr:hypothetical protein [Paenibacillus endophyticus]MBB3152080.1 hypothetical protein [Paenibacillus endophyticus]